MQIVHCSGVLKAILTVWVIFVHVGQLWQVFRVRCLYIFSSPEPKAHGELIVYQSSRRPSVRACVHASTLSNMNISATSKPIAAKFYPKHHWVGGKAA